jgi:glycosyltransferase involved in cell wall biosynthesis
VSPVQPKVSVVMPVYNTERHVEAAIRSVLASDLAALEVIALDDGSGDRSLAILRSIQDPRLVVVPLPASGGPSRPRNLGIAQARAPYVALLDADDLMKPDKLSMAVAALDAHPEAGIAFGDYERIDADGHLFEESTLSGYPMFAQLPATPVAGGWRLIKQPDFILGLLHENFIGTSGVVLRKSVLDRVGSFDETLTYSEDRDLWFRVAHASAALYIARIGHSYRVAPGSLSFRPGDRQARSRITVLRRERQRWHARGPRREIDRRIAENLAAIGYEHRRCGRRLAAFATFLRATAVSPDARWLRAAAGSLAPSLNRR